MPQVTPTNPAKPSSTDSNEYDAPTACPKSTTNTPLVPHQPGPTLREAASPAAEQGAVPQGANNDPLSASVNLVLHMHTLVVTACPPLSALTGSAGKVLSSRFLISLFSLDAFSWAIGKAFQYEVVLLAEEAGWCYVFVALAMTTAETFMEFVASYLTPYIFSRVQSRNRVTSKQLVVFAVKAYTASNIIALFVYPVFGVLIHIMGMKDAWLIWLLGVVRSLQYAFGNQVGDAAVEMAKPHWLATFNGIRLTFPGCRCPFRMVRPVTPTSLAFYLMIMRYTTGAGVGAVYVMLRKQVFLRWGMMLVFMVFNVFGGVQLLRQFSRLAAAIVEEEVEKEDAPAVRSLGSLYRAEVSFLLFYVTLKGLPPQASEAMASVLILELPSIVMLCIFVIILLLINGALLANIHRDAKLHSLEHEDRVARVPRTGSSSFKKGWLLPLAGITVLTGMAAGCTVLASGFWLWVGLSLFLPVVPLAQTLESRIDTFLLLYDELRSSDIVYWANVLQVFVNGPLLVANWGVTKAAKCGDEDTEVLAAGYVLLICVALLFCVCLFYGIVDPHFKNGSLTQLVAQTGYLSPPSPVPPTIVGA